jgi:hypothetical protein
MRTNASTRVAAAVTAAYVLEVAGQSPGRRRGAEVRGGGGGRAVRRPRPAALRSRDHGHRSPPRVG